LNITIWIVSYKGENMNKLTKAAIKGYIRSGGVYCPYCGSHDLDEFGQDFDETGIQKYIRCLACDERWTDIYTLKDMTPEED